MTQQEYVWWIINLHAEYIYILCVRRHAGNHRSCFTFSIILQQCSFNSCQCTYTDSSHRQASHLSLFECEMMMLHLLSLLQFSSLLMMCNLVLSLPEFSSLSLLEFSSLLEAVAAHRFSSFLFSTCPSYSSYHGEHVLGALLHCQVSGWACSHSASPGQHHSLPPCR